MKQTGIFEGHAEVLYNYGRFGWTRNYGKTWHGGIDIVGLDSDKIRMPYYDGKKITGTVTRARIVTNRADKTWEWGWYVCVQLDAGQTPDTVNFLYFCHCAKLLVSVGQKISSGDALGIMGNTGNAAGGYKHCHFEVRATATGTAGNDQRATEPVHKTDLYICTFHRHISSYHNCLPRGKTDHANGFPC